jgi:hypothetical protein
MDDRVFYGVLFLLLLAPWLVIFSGLWAVIHRRRKEASRFDGLWDWLGRGTRDKGAGRVWSGQVDGRDVRVDFYEDTTVVRVEARPKVRVGFGREDEPQSVIAEARDGGHVYTLGSGEVGYAEEPSVVPAIVRQPGVEEALRMLLASDGESLRSIDVDPKAGVGWFVRNLPEKMFEREDAKRWVRAIVALATAAETVPA